MTENLYNIPLAAWVSRTAERMEAAGVKDRGSWSRYWVETHDALGGTSPESGRKACPRSAAYALWYLGWLKGSKHPPLDWSAKKIRDELGKNAAYAAIAVRLITRGPQPEPVSQIWKLVQQEFEQETGETAANSEQGAVKIAVGLFLEKKLLTK